MIRENVVSYVRRNGIKQVYLSKKTGMTTYAISSIMNGKRGIEADEYCAICKALNVSLDYFASSQDVQDQDSV